MNAEFQRIARNFKKGFLSDQCKERERIEWERLEIFEKIRDSKGSFHASMKYLHNNGQIWFGPKRSRRY